MKINHNIPAMVVNKQLLHIEGNMSKSMERLSSGLKLNHAKDNPAGMAISKKMRAQIAGLDRASENASDGISAIRIADGALNETTSILQRMRELCVQAANDTNSLEDRQAIQQELDALKEEVTRISNNTEYNEMPLLDGSLSARVYAEHVERVQVSDRVIPGNYKLEVTKPATQTKIVNDGTVIDSADTTTEIGVSGTFDINGSKVEINETDTYAQVYEKLRDAAELGSAELLSDNGLTFVSEEYGKYANVELNFSSQELAAAIGYGGAVYDAESGSYVVKLDSNDANRGKDAEIKLHTKTNDPDSEFGDTATVSQDNNKVTITDRNGFSMSFLLEEGYSSTEPINFEVTDIGTMKVHIGANKDQNMVVSIPEVSAESLYIDDIDVTKLGGADRALRRLDDALAAASAARSSLGAYENRLEYSTSSLDAFGENMTDALSRLSDTDMAQEMTEYTRQNVLNQAAISVLTQANEMPQAVLQLLQ